KCYFAKPYASWERSLNEHTNGLSRQYLPKKTEFIDIEDDEILAIQKALNNRSRKVLNYRIPNEVMRRIEKPLGIALHG
ncbi:MAG: IS30 family transposase, partial [Endozoicomonadaceae bacterium]|nr:IS30 family transposase [Endozoicomonadaceae bacterium]